MTVHDLKAYVRQKQKDGLKPQSIISMFKIVKAFFSWCVREEYIPKNIAMKVELSKLLEKILKGYTPIEVESMIKSFMYKSYFEAREESNYCYAIRLRILMF